MIDLQKASDTVDHHILCRKLNTVGVNDTKWFPSDLTTRKQHVNVTGVDSKLLNITCGVPQGSILLPLLFFVKSTTCLAVFIPIANAYVTPMTAL